MKIKATKGTGKSKKGGLSFCSSILDNLDRDKKEFALENLKKFVDAFNQGLIEFCEEVRDSKRLPKAEADMIQEKISEMKFYSKTSSQKQKPP